MFTMLKRNVVMFIVHTFPTNSFNTVIIV